MGFCEIMLLWHELNEYLGEEKFPDVLPVRKRRIEEEEEKEEEE